MMQHKMFNVCVRWNWTKYIIKLDNLSIFCRFFCSDIKAKLQFDKVNNRFYFDIHHSVLIEPAIASTEHPKSHKIFNKIMKSVLLYCQFIIWFVWHNWGERKELWYHHITLHYRCDVCSCCVLLFDGSTHFISFAKMEK